MTLYFHKFCENCVIRENLIHETLYVYLLKSILSVIGMKK